MYGYSALRLDVEANGVLAVTDNIDGKGLDLGDVWVKFLATQPGATDLRARRFWEATSASSHTPSSGAAGAWYESIAEYGPYGLRGRVRDTKGKKPPRAVAVDDATVYPHRNLLHIPDAKRGAVLASEVMGRSRVYRKVLDAFSFWFEQNFAGVQVNWTIMADDEFREEFLDTASLLSVTVKRQLDVPGYSDAGGSGQSVAALLTTEVKPAGWGERFPGSWIRALLNGDATPRATFALDFDPIETDLVVHAKGQTRTIHLEVGNDPLLLYPLGNPKRRDRPTNDEFYDSAVGTLSRLSGSFAS